MTRIATTLIVAVVGVGALTAPALATDSNTCSTGTLPRVVLVDPQVKPGATLGVYLHHTSSGYHLRAAAALARLP